MGENSTREAYDGCCYNIHAEMDAIRRLPPLDLRGRKRAIILLVVRIDKLGNLKNSEPCFKCIEYIEKVNLKTSYKIKHVCYSDANGDIIIKKCDELINAEIKHVSLHFRRKNNNNK